MFGISLDPIKIITRGWAMGKLGRTLIVALLAMIGIAVFVFISSEPKLLTECPYYSVIAGIWILGIIGLYLWSGSLSELPRLKLTFGGGSRPGREDVGDNSYHIGGLYLVLLLLQQTRAVRN